MVSFWIKRMFTLFQTVHTQNYWLDHSGTSLRHQRLPVEPTRRTLHLLRAVSTRQDLCKTSWDRNHWKEHLISDERITDSKTRFQTRDPLSCLLTARAGPEDTPSVSCERRRENTLDVFHSHLNTLKTQRRLFFQYGDFYFPGTKS